VFARAWAIARTRWQLLVFAGLAIFIPVGLFEVVGEELQEQVGEAELEVGRLIAVAVSAFLLGAGALLGDILYAGVVAGVVVDERKGARRPLREVLSHVPILRLLGADLLLGFLIVLGLLLLVAPGLLMLTWFALVAPVIEVERRGVRAAFGRSRALVRGHFWLVFWIVIPVVLASEFISVFIQSGALGVLGEGFLGEWAGGVIANVLTAPLFALAVVVLYFELRESRD
jgi:hypothetical protein